MRPGQDARPRPVATAIGHGHSLVDPPLVLLVGEDLHDAARAGRAFYGIEENVGNDRRSQCVVPAIAQGDPEALVPIDGIAADGVPGPAPNLHALSLIEGNDVSVLWIEAADGI